MDIVDSVNWSKGIGCTKITKREDEGSGRGNVEMVSCLENKLVFCFGSHVASQMLLPFGEETFLSVSELKQAQEITALSMGNQYEFEVASKVEKMYTIKPKKCFRKTDRLLKRSRKNCSSLKLYQESLLFVPGGME
ncbi:hypothetical protein V2J09_023631 [Rumex salicifolius]